MSGALILVAMLPLVIGKQDFLVNLTDFIVLISLADA